MLRKAKVVGKFVEFFGEGAASLPVTDRATIANMAPEYGATMGFFPVDEESCQYLLATGRDAPSRSTTFRALLPGAGAVRHPPPRRVRLHRGPRARPRPRARRASPGPKRPQDRIDLPDLEVRFRELFSKPVSENGYGKPEAALSERFVGRPSGGGQSRAAAASSRRASAAR